MTNTHVFRFALITFLSLLTAACELNVTVDDTDTTVSGSTVYELFVIQRDQDEAYNILFVPDASYGDQTAEPVNENKTLIC